MISPCGKSNGNNSQGGYSPRKTGLIGYGKGNSYQLGGDDKVSVTTGTGDRR